MSPRMTNRRIRRWRGTSHCHRSNKNNYNPPPLLILHLRGMEGVADTHCVADAHLRHMDYTTIASSSTNKTHPLDRETIQTNDDKANGQVDKLLAQLKLVEVFQS